MNKMRNLGKRGLALLLALILLVGMVPMSAFAASGYTPVTTVGIYADKKPTDFSNSTTATGLVRQSGQSLSMKVGQKASFLNGAPSNTLRGQNCGHTVASYNPSDYCDISLIDNVTPHIVGNPTYVAGTNNGARVFDTQFEAICPGTSTDVRVCYYANFGIVFNTGVPSAYVTCPACGYNTLVYADQKWYRYNDVFSITVNADYVLNYNTQGGSAVPSTTNTVAATSANVQVTTTKPTKSGYTFKGWAETADGAVKYNGGENITLNWVSGPTVTKTLYAVWEEDNTPAATTYRVNREYYINGEKVATITGGTSKGQVGDEIVGATLAATNPNWNSRTVDGESVAFTYASCTPTTKLVLTDDVSSNVITLRYEKNDLFTVKYTDGTGGDVFGDESHGNLKVGDDTPAFLGSTNRDGYTFMGWAPAVNPKVSAADAANGVITYTATWKRNETPNHEHNYTWADNGNGTHTGTCTGEGTCDQPSITESHTSDGNWTTSKQPTCTEPGEKISHCTVCNGEIKETISAIGHTPGEWDTAQQPTCTEKGKEVQKCTVCGTTLDEREIDATGHSWGEWTDDPETGKHRRVCANDATHVETAEHTYPSAWTPNPETGEDEKACNDCGHVITRAAVEYKVQWLDNDGHAIAGKDEMTRMGKDGETVFAAEDDKKVDGYTFNESDARNIVEGTLAKDGGEIVLKLYFTKDSEEPDPTDEPTPSPTPNVRPPVIIPTPTPGIDIEDPDIPMGTPEPTATPTPDPGQDIEDPDTPLGPDPILDTENHVPYYSGYEDGTIRPLSNITRAEVAEVLYHVMAADSRAQFWATSNQFSDVANGKWYSDAINVMAKAGIMSGYGDGTARPNQAITRGEFASLVSKFLANYVGEIENSRFTDIQGHWAESAIRKIENVCWVNGDEGTTHFRPDEPINRAEAAAVFNKMLGHDAAAEAEDTEELLALEGLKQWPDNQPGDWYYYHMLEASNGHECVKDENGITSWTKIVEVDWSARKSYWAANSGQSPENWDAAQ